MKRTLAGQLKETEEQKRVVMAWQPFLASLVQPLEASLLWLFCFETRSLLVSL